MITNSAPTDKSDDLFESFRSSIQSTETFKQPHVVVVFGASVANLFARVKHFTIFYSNIFLRETCPKRKFIRTCGSYFAMVCCPRSLSLLVMREARSK